MKTTTKKEKSKKVNFSLLAPQAESVSIAGDFNNWNTISHPMKRDKEGIWKIEQVFLCAHSCFLVVFRHIALRSSSIVDSNCQICWHHV